MNQHLISLMFNFFGEVILVDDECKHMINVQAIYY